MKKKQNPDAELPIEEAALNNVELNDERADDSAERAVAPLEAGLSRDSHIGDRPSRDPIAELARLLRVCTRDGLFPVVAYGVAPQRGQGAEVCVLTTSIFQLPEAIELVEDWTQHPAHPGFSHRVGKLKEIYAKNSFIHGSSQVIGGLEFTSQKSHIIFQFSQYMASRWDNRGFVLFDIVGFSSASSAEQLALRMSLGQTINQVCRRLEKFVGPGLLSNRAITFNRISSGDGFYLWSFDSTDDGHLATFLLMLLVAAQVEAMREEYATPLRIRSAYATGNAYTFPYFGPGASAAGGSSFMPDAIGPVLNALNRFLVDAQPGQILCSPFNIPPSVNRKSGLNATQTLTAIRTEFLPRELPPGHDVKPADIILELAPSTEFRVTDKHGEVHHCLNVIGRIPNDFSRMGLRLVDIGLTPDPAPELGRSTFK